MEVVVSIALMGTILVSMLTAHGRLVRQSTRAEITRTAAVLADDMLAEWFVDNSIPPTGTGTVEADPRFHWSTSVVNQIRVSSNDALIVRFQIHGPNHGKLELVFETELVLEKDQ